jgi:hypothetical protein
MGSPFYCFDLKTHFGFIETIFFIVNLSAELTGDGRDGGLVALDDAKEKGHDPGVQGVEPVFHEDLMKWALMRRR